MSRLEKKLELCFENGNYYEAHQIYRTLYNRMSSQGKWQELKSMLYNGALRLLADRAWVDDWEQSLFFTLFSRLPAQLEKDLENSSEQEDRRKQYISLGVKWTMTLSDRGRHRQRGHPDLHIRLARSLWREGYYASARNHFMHSDDMQTFARFLIEYQLKYGHTTEKDLFITQAVLQLLCNRRQRSAFQLLKTYCVRHPDIKSAFPYPFPLLNFLYFAIICIANKELTFFTVLVEQYRNELSRDPDYMHYLDRLGQIYLGLPQPQSARGGFLGNMIKGLLTTSESEPGAAEESDTDPEEKLYVPLGNDVEGSMGTSQTKSRNKISPEGAAQSTGGIADDMDLD